jgi:arylsulfatase A-like enzyme
MDAHWAYRPPPPFDVRYPGKDDSLTQEISELEKLVLTLRRGVTQKERQHLISQYDGELAYLDFQLGRLFARLKELGLYNSCLLIITSDHGEAFGEKSLLKHATSVYQDQVHVPLIIKYPTITKKSVVNEFVSLVDLMPTVVDVLGYEVPPGVRGQSLLKLEHTNGREVISESFATGSRRGMHPRFRRVERAIFLGTFKLISSTNGKRELYDLSKDPHEQHNLYRADDPVSQQLEAKLDEWVKSVRPRRGQPAKLDRETLDRLKSLGYVQ